MMRYLLYFLRGIIVVGLTIIFIIPVVSTSAFQALDGCPEEETLIRRILKACERMQTYI